jgi:hypothetical protein
MSLFPDSYEDPFSDYGGSEFKGFSLDSSIAGASDGSFAPGNGSVDSSAAPSVASSAASSGVSSMSNVSAASGLSSTQSALMNTVNGTGFTSAPTATGNPPGVAELVTVAGELLQSQKMLPATRLNHQAHQVRRGKVYVSMPSMFNGKVGDYIENWLEQFQSWFLHSERVEQAPVDDREKIETAMQSCEPHVSAALQNHQKQVAEFSTWESFSHHMKAAYRSQETGFQC